MNKYIKYSLVFIIISIIGITIYLFAVKSNNHSEMDHKNEIYTCSMHPQIIRDKPGSCPICGMNLVKKATEDQTVDNHSIDNVLKPTDNFIVGNYPTTTAKDTAISNEINLPGVVEYDPNSAVNIAAWISGRIEKMYVNFKFQKVAKGQKLFDLYSPELLTEQQNFIYLITNDSENKSIIKASKQKLLLYGMTQNQINALVSTKTVKPQITIYSPASGIIDGTQSMTSTSNSPMERTSTEVLSVKEGDYIKKSQVVFKLVNTDKVWGIFNINQGDNSLIKLNQSISITTELDGNNSFNAKINFVETQLNAIDKTNRIRVYLNNSVLKLPIGLRLEGKVKTNFLNGIWLSKESYVSIGDKKIVFLKVDGGFEAISIKTGIEMDDFVQVLDGITIKDKIAQKAHYLMDSESFIKTK
ncbi:efflux RND transporter periplasmic adaptor subunit [Flavobacterium cellulosilyticum]|uniref:Efflux RND transporter periplasmic adaptor subunit n=1 Tax=Flavobacterium cellulosilyticum TaxID=2541731 RepID=A0A4R5CCB6_9FLAO|nr:efflux RND transporter periplasmic adaptor subunit [Flavobacterium cellulosilyticum]TDD97085.1 efflux RND transporter periplasmic adaptor subunit [Flavobacterium cellulosilyticum]